MNYIKLTQGKYAIVDNEDYEELNKYNWYAHYRSNTKSYYVMRAKPTGNGGQIKLSMHRKIMNAQKGEQIDHINHDTLDNRKKNLRIATGTQNCANRKTRSDNTSGYKGVRWHKRDKIWEARIGYRDKKIYLGYFNNKKDAARIYNDTAKKYFGEYSKLNDI